MLNQDYILLIMNCRKYKYKATIQKQSWLIKLPSYIQYYHVIGDETLDGDFSFDSETNVLRVKVADDYNSLPKKVIAAYKAVLQTFNVKYILKTDDDQILLKDSFFDILKGLISHEYNIHYGGFIVDVKQNHLSQYHKIHPELPEYLPILKTRYCSGRFYFLSKLAVVNLVSKCSLIEKEYFEDYAIGYHLDNVYKTNMLHILTNNFFIDIEKSEYANCCN